MGSMASGEHLDLNLSTSRSDTAPSATIGRLDLGESKGHCGLPLRVSEQVRRTSIEVSVCAVVSAHKPLLLRPRLIRDRPLRCLLGGERRGRRLLVGLHDGVGGLLTRLGVADCQDVAPRQVLCMRVGELPFWKHLSMRTLSRVEAR